MTRLDRVRNEHVRRFRGQEAIKDMVKVKQRIKVEGENGGSER